jgi:tetratricopeptide (TPR) repeat protein
VLLARAYSDLFGTGAVALDEIKEPWGNAVQTALSLDENSAGAQAAHAQFLWWNGLEGADDAFEKARQLEPANSDIMSMYATYLRLNFHFDQSLQLYQSARELDPLSIMILHGLARIHEARREVDEALELWARVRQIDPSSSVGIGPPSGAYTLIGNMVQSNNFLFKAMAVDPDDSDIQIYIALGYADFGDYDRAAQWLSWIRQHDSDNPLNLSAMAMLYIYQGNVDEAIRYTRQVLDGQMPDRHDSDSVHIRTLLIWALDQGQTSTALKMVRQAHPELFEQNPVVDTNNVLQAIDTAHLLQSEKHYDEAETLLLAAIAEYDRPYARFDAGKAQALALLGKKQAALTELRHRVDQGWRVSWRWDTELNPNFESLRDEREFQSIVEFLRTDMARQYKEFQAMEAAGEIPSPPAGEAL